jgi:hypothetical protein
MPVTFLYRNKLRYNKKAEGPGVLFVFSGLKQAIFVRETGFLVISHLHYNCIKDRPGEAKGMKKALPCDTLSATAMLHRRKTEVH